MAGPREHLVVRGPLVLMCRMRQPLSESPSEQLDRVNSTGGISSGLMMRDLTAVREGGGARCLSLRCLILFVSTAQVSYFWMRRLL